ncbi:MAG: hypothetical protein IPN56_13830 [Chitinophagaceae bacterium]|nr:hypothetical protein [Chitinophagaceae bacterium]
MLICVRSAGYVADSSTKMRIYSSPPADAKLNVVSRFSSVTRFGKSNYNKNDDAKDDLKNEASTNFFCTGFYARFCHAFDFLYCLFC